MTGGEPDADRGESQRELTTISRPTTPLPVPQLGAGRRGRQRRGWTWAAVAPRKVWAVFLLVIHQLIAATYLVMQGTPILDVLVDEPDSRGWLNLSTYIQIFTWILLVPAILYGLFVIGQITCCENRVAEAAMKDANLSRKAAKNICVALYRWFSFYSGPHSRWYLHLLLSLEVVEIVFQILAVEQFSVGGINLWPMVMYGAVLLLNSLSPLMLATMFSSQRQQDRSRLGRSIRTVMLFDATLDIAYTAFPLVNVVLTYSRLWFVDERFPHYCHQLSPSFPGDTCTGIKSYMLLGTARAVFFGATSVGQAIIKIVSRALPLLLTPRRIEHAEIAEVLIGATVSQEAYDSWANTLPSTNDGEGRAKKEESRVASLANQAATRIHRSLDRRSTLIRALYYKPVHWGIALPSFAAMVGTCLFILIRLAAWPECSIPEIRQQCIIRTFPIFRLDEDIGCACNTLGNGAVNRSRCHTEPTYVSRTLGSKDITLEFMETIGVNACPHDRDLLDMLTKKVSRPVIVGVRTMPDSNDTVPVWTTPSAVAWKKWQGIDSLRLYGVKFAGGVPSALWDIVNIKELAIADSHFGATHGGGIGDARISRLSNLRGLHIVRCGLQALPASLFQGLTSLRVLYLSENRLTTLPRSIAQGLTSLTQFRLDGNGLLEVPDLSGLSNLERMFLQRNALKSLPPSAFRDATNSLEILNLGQNPGLRLTDDDFGKYTMKKLTDLDLDKIGNKHLPDLTGLVSLRRLSLANNPGLESLGKSAILDQSPVLERLVLQGTNISDLTQLLGPLHTWNASGMIQSPLGSDGPVILASPSSFPCTAEAIRYNVKNWKVICNHDQYSWDHRLLTRRSGQCRCPSGVTYYVSGLCGTCQPLACIGGTEVEKCGASDPGQSWGFSRVVCSADGTK